MGGEAALFLNATYSAINGKYCCSVFLSATCLCISESDAFIVLATTAPRTNLALPTGTRSPES